MQVAQVAWAHGDRAPLLLRHGKLRRVAGKVHLEFLEVPCNSVSPFQISAAKSDRRFVTRCKGCPQARKKRWQ